MEDERRERPNRIVEGVIWKEILVLFFPILLGSFFQLLYNTVDAVIVGRFVGKEALSAVGGSAEILINLLIGFFGGLSSGAAVCISQYYGARKEEDVEKCVHTAISLALAGGLVLMVVGLSGAGWALKAMGVPDEVYIHSVTYMRIYFCGVVATLIYNLGAGILRAVGDTKKPLYFLMISCAFNVVMDLLLVAVFQLGIAGAAIATVMSQILSAVLVCSSLMRTKDCYRLEWKKVRFHKAYLQKMVGIGIPGGLQSVMYSISNLVIQTCINGYGTNTIAAWTVYGKIDAYFWLTISSMGTAITTFVGQNYGAGKPKRVKKGTTQCLVMSFGIAITISIVLYSFGEMVYRFFLADEEVIALGVRMMQFLVPWYFTYVCIEVLSGSLRGIGIVFVPTLMTLFGVCALRLLWVFAAVPRIPGIETLLFSYPFTWVIASLGFIIYYRLVMRRPAAASEG